MTVASDRHDSSRVSGEKQRSDLSNSYSNGDKLLLTARGIGVREFQNELIPVKSFQKNFHTDFDVNPSVI